MMTDDPIQLFREWQAEAGKSGRLSMPNAACLSTVDDRGWPEARIIDLKHASDSGFVFITSLDSAKGRALAANPVAALTCWWDHLERQVRIVGRVERVPDPESDSLFAARSRDARITAWASTQSAPLSSDADLEQRVAAARERFDGKDVPRPPYWVGFRLVPTRMEFLKFRASRLHERQLFELRDGIWNRSRLQP